jgi:hypothetical protein
MINTSSTPKPPGLQESADGASGKKGRKKRGKLKYIFNCMCLKQISTNEELIYHSESCELFVCGYQDIWSMIDKFAGNPDSPDLEALMNLYNVLALTSLSLKERINYVLDANGVHHSDSSDDGRAPSQVHNDVHQMHP